MNDITREYLLRKAMDAKYLVQESSNDKNTLQDLQLNSILVKMVDT